MQFIKLLVVAIFLLSGCTAAVVKKVDVENGSKIRVFHSGSIYLHPNQKCFGADSPQSLRAAVGGYSFLVSNKKVGMPVTDDTPWSYHEYVMPAGKPLTIEMYFATENFSCGPIGAYFIPEKGKNYDTKMMFDSSTDTCSVRVRELIMDENQKNKASSRIMETVIAPKC